MSCARERSLRADNNNEVEKTLTCPDASAAMTEVRRSSFLVTAAHLFSPAVWGLFFFGRPGSGRFAYVFFPKANFRSSTMLPSVTTLYSASSASKVLSSQGA